MYSRLALIWHAVRSSYWFVPGLLVLGAIGTALGSIRLDRRLGADVGDTIAWLWTGDPEGARALLSTLAGSIITVTGVVFSITMVALSLTANQFGPRILRSFMRDQGTQVALGTFTGTFVYCLLVLRAVRSDAVGVFIPHLSVSLAVLFALLSVAVLIYFLHHVAMSMQPEDLVHDVALEFAAAIRHAFPAREAAEPGACADEAPRPPAPLERGAAVDAPDDGYLQTWAREQLLAIATQEDLVLKLFRKPGEFVFRGTPLLYAWPAERCRADAVSRLQGAAVLGIRRTSAQDVEYSAQQLVEIAVRSLSPGINNPSTAKISLDWLGAGLLEAAQRARPACLARDADGKPRVLEPRTGFADLADIAFNQIRQYGAGNLTVAARMLETMISIAAVVHRDADRQSLRRHVEWTAEAAHTALRDARDRAAIQALRERAREVLEGPVPPAAAAQRDRAESR